MEGWGLENKNGEFVDTSSSICHVTSPTRCSVIRWSIMLVTWIMSLLSSRFLTLARIGCSSTTAGVQAWTVSVFECSGESARRATTYNTGSMFVDLNGRYPGLCCLECDDACRFFASSIRSTTSPGNGKSVTLRRCQACVKRQAGGGVLAAPCSSEGSWQWSSSTQTWNACDGQIENMQLVSVWQLSGH